MDVDELKVRFGDFEGMYLFFEEVFLWFYELEEEFMEVVRKFYFLLVKKFELVFYFYKELFVIGGRVEDFVKEFYKNEY